MTISDGFAKIVFRITLIIFAVIVGIVLITLILRHLFLLPARPGMDAMEYPAWSSSGEYIAYECVYLTEEFLLASLSLDGGHQEHIVQDVCIQEANNGRFTRLTNTGGMRYPSWSPNSRYLAWIHGWESIVVWDSYTDTLRQYPYPGIDLYHIPNPWQRIEWSLDGSRLHLQDIAVQMELETGVFTHHDDALDGKTTCCPALSPSGEYLAYIKHEPPSDKSLGSTWLSVLNDDRIIVKEMSHEVEIGSLAWSNDGDIIAWFAQPIGWNDLPVEGTPVDLRRWLAFTHVPSGQTKLFIFDDVIISDYPMWSPTDRAIALLSNDELKIINLNIKLSPFDVRVENHFAFPLEDAIPRNPIAWSPFGDSIAYSSRDGMIHIVQFEGDNSILSEP